MGHYSIFCIPILLLTSLLHVVALDYYYFRCVTSSTGDCGTQTGGESSSTKIRELYALQGSEIPPPTTYRMGVTNHVDESNNHHIRPVLKKQERQQISRKVLSEQMVRKSTHLEVYT